MFTVRNRLPQEVWEPARNCDGSSTFACTTGDEVVAASRGVPIPANLDPNGHPLGSWHLPGLGATWKTNNADRDTPLGTLFTDAYRAWTGTDIAIEPIGFLGDPLPQGTIVGADVFRAMSYGSPAVVDGKQIVRPWRLVTFRATGDALMTALEVALTIGGDFFPQVSGLRMDYDSSAAEGKILRNTVHVNRQQLVPDQLYSVTVTEGVYYALISLGLTMQDVEKLPTTAFDAARSFVVLKGQVGRATSNRIHDIAAIPGRGR